MARTLLPPSKKSTIHLERASDFPLVAEVPPAPQAPQGSPVPLSSADLNFQIFNFFCATHPFAKSSWCSVEGFLLLLLNHFAPLVSAIPIIRLTDHCRENKAPSRPKGRAAEDSVWSIQNVR